MECNCTTELEAKVVVEHQHKGKAILKAEIPKGFIIKKTENGQKMTTSTYTEVEVQVEGMKRAQVVQLLHTYCPFCGVKI